MVYYYQFHIPWVILLAAPWSTCRRQCHYLQHHGTLVRHKVSDILQEEEARPVVVAVRQIGRHQRVLELRILPGKQGFTPKITIVAIRCRLLRRRPITQSK